MKHKKEVSAGGVVYKREGPKVLWLITQHSQHKGWGFPKGLVGDEDRDEALETAAIREVREEGGITAQIINNKPVKTSYTYKFQNNLVYKTVYYFLMEYISGDIRNHDWEVVDSRFATEEDVRSTLTYKTDKEAFAQILNIFHAR